MLKKEIISRAGVMVSIRVHFYKTHVEALSPGELLRGGESLAGSIYMDRVMFLL